MTVADAMVRDCCELSEADPAHPDTLCISVNELAGVVARYCGGGPTALERAGRQLQQASQERDRVYAGRPKGVGWTAAVDERYAQAVRALVAAALALEEEEGDACRPPTTSATD